MTALYARFKSPSRYDFTNVCLTAVLWFVWLTNPWQVEITLLALTFSFWSILKGRFLTWGFFAALALLVSFWIQTSAPLVAQVDTELEVVGVTKMGPIVSWQGRSVFLPARGTFWVGDQLRVRGLVLPLNQRQTVGNSFDLTAYLRGQNVSHWIRYPRLETSLTCDSLLCQLGQNLAVRQDLTGRYAALFLTGQNIYLTGDFYRQITRLNLSHLFVISGFHIGLVWRSLVSLIRLTGWRSGSVEWLVLGGLFFYGYWLNYHDSFLRATILLAFYLVNKRFVRCKVSKASLVTLASLVMLIARPWLIYRWSFLLAYAAHLTLAHGSEKSFQSRFSKATFCALGPYWATLPLVAKIGGGFNLSAPLLSYWLGPFVLVAFLATLALYPCLGDLDWLYWVLDQLVQIAIRAQWTLKLGQTPAELVWSAQTLLYAYLIISEPCNLSTGANRTGSVRNWPRPAKSLPEH